MSFKKTDTFQDHLDTVWHLSCMVKASADDGKTVFRQWLFIESDIRFLPTLFMKPLISAVLRLLAISIKMFFVLKTGIFNSSVNWKVSGEGFFPWAVKVAEASMISAVFNWPSPMRTSASRSSLISLRVKIVSPRQVIWRIELLLNR